MLRTDSARGESSLGFDAAILCDVEWADVFWTVGDVSRVGDGGKRAAGVLEDLCDVMVEVTDSSSRSCSDCEIAFMSESNSFRSAMLSSPPAVLFERALVG